MNIRTTGSDLISQESIARNSLLQILVFLTAVACRLPALSSWWCLDDWGQLGRAAGLVPYEFGARWLSQSLWWELTWQFGGLNPDFQTWCRILIHAISATTVFRIGQALNLTMLGQTLTGILFAATPIAFTALFWASGIQELLAGLFALLAIELWLRKGLGNAVGSLICGVCSFLAKETGFGLPFLFLLLNLLPQARDRKESQVRLGIIALLLVCAILEGVLVLRHFARGPGGPYQLGGPGVVLGNLGMYGWWLGTPGPVFASRITIPMATVGIGAFVVWALWAARSWRNKQRPPLVLLGWGLLFLGPALPLVRQAHPYLAYLTVAAVALSLGSLVPGRWAGGWIVLAMAIVGGSWGYWGMRARIGNVTDNGQVADPVVRAAVLAEEAAVALSPYRQNGNQPGTCRYAILQPPIAKADAVKAAQNGPGVVEKSPRFMALGGVIGPALILGCREPVLWVNSLEGMQQDRRIFCETGQGLIAWGDTWSALLYSALLDISLGHFDRAARELQAAAALDPEFAKFPFDERKIPGWSSKVDARMAEFRKWARTPAAGGSLGQSDPQEIETLVLHLLDSMAKSPR